MRVWPARLPNIRDAAPLRRERFGDRRFGQVRVGRDDRRGFVGVGVSGSGSIGVAARSGRTWRRAYRRCGGHLRGQPAMRRRRAELAPRRADAPQAGLDERPRPVDADAQVGSGAVPRRRSTRAPRAHRGGGRPAPAASVSAAACRPTAPSHRPDPATTTPGPRRASSAAPRRTFVGEETAAGRRRSRRGAAAGPG